MKFGVAFANTGRFATGEGAVAMATAAENAGIESVWTVEHVIIPEGYESEYPYDKSGKIQGPDTSAIPDPLIWLTYCAAVTTKLNLGTGILIVPQRNPLVLGKECATLDAMSGGRLLLGVGAGWLEEEFDAIGVPFADRGKRLDDHIHAMRALWSKDDDASTYHGEFTTFDRAYSFPKPAQASIPIVVGGHSKAAARRAGRLGDGFFPGKGSNEALKELFAVMRAAALEADRDPDAIEITAGSASVFGSDPVGAIRELEDMGVSRVIIPPLSFRTAEIAGAFEQFAENVIAKVT